LLGQSQAASNALIYAETKVGIKEEGYNRGFEIDRMNKQVGNCLGSSWCMAFVYDCYSNCGFKNPLMKTGRCATQLRYAKMIGSKMRVFDNRIIGSTKFKVLAGDIFIMSHKGVNSKLIGKDWDGHTGLGKYDYG
jgi:hypothetical protein